MRVDHLRPHAQLLGAMAAGQDAGDERVGRAEAERDGQRQPRVIQIGEDPQCPPRGQTPPVPARRHLGDHLAAALLDGAQRQAGFGVTDVLGHEAALTFLLETPCAVSYLESRPPALDQIAQRGGGLVEAISEITAGRQAQGRFLFSATVELLEQHSFSRGRRVGKHAWIMSRSVDPA